MHDFGHTKAWRGGGEGGGGEGGGGEGGGGEHAFAWPCFFINLASRPDRRRRMERLLGAHALRAAVRVKAVTKEAAAVREILEEFPAKRAGNVACSLSHFEAWRRARPSPRPAGLAGRRALAPASPLPLPPSRAWAVGTLPRLPPAVAPAPSRTCRR